MTACPENCSTEKIKAQFRSLPGEEVAPTPLMNNPKLNGNLLHRGPTVVCIGSHKLPGEVCLIHPSEMRTRRRVILDNIPRREVRDRNRSGRKVVGRILQKRVTLSGQSEAGRDSSNLHHESKSFEGRTGNVGEESRHGITEKYHKGYTKRSQFKNDCTRKR